MMKTVRYYGIEDVRYEELAVPEVGADDVLIKVLYAGICGSDLHIYRKGMFVQRIPETMGHEFVGVIEALGENVNGFKPGQLVTANPMVPCMECDSCRAGNYNTCDSLGFIGEVRPGCFAGYISMPEKDVIPIPGVGLISLDDGNSNGNEMKLLSGGNGNTYKKGNEDKCEIKNTDKIEVLKKIRKYVLTEPLAVALNVCHRINCSKNDKVAIIGAGPIGLLCCSVLKQVEGVAHVTLVDLAEARLAYGKAIGADLCIQNSDDLTDDYDVIVDCAGVAPSVNGAVKHVRSNGRIGIVSVFENPVGIDCSEIVNRQLNIIGANVYHRSDMEEAAELLSNNAYNFETVITNEFPPEDCKKAFALLNSGNKNAEKVVFTFT